MSNSEIKYCGIAPTVSFEKAAARPKKPRKKRLPPFSVRLTEQERAWLQGQAGGRPLGAYIKEKALSDAPVLQKSRRKGSSDYAALGQALGGLGQSRLASNMNQIAKAANMGSLPVTPDLIQELHEACAEIRVMRMTLIAALGIKPEDGQ